jgi:hypothetical protein
MPVILRFETAIVSSSCRLIDCLCQLSLPISLIRNFCNSPAMLLWGNSELFLVYLFAEWG